MNRQRPRPLTRRDLILLRLAIRLAESRHRIFGYGWDLDFAKPAPWHEPPAGARWNGWAVHTQAAHGRRS